jgi:hypothetical protein
VFKPKIHPASAMMLILQIMQSAQFMPNNDSLENASKVKHSPGAVVRDVFWGKVSAKEGIFPIKNMHLQ